MQKNGFDIKSVNTNDMDTVKQHYRIPKSVKSCHTAIVNGYVLEGHVPANDVKRLLKENPDHIIGLTVPGMPAGTNVPGMEVNNEKANFDVLAIDSNGKSSVWAHYE